MKWKVSWWVSGKAITFSDGQAHLSAFNCRMVLLSALWPAAASLYLLTWKRDNQILAAGQIQGSLDSQGKMLVVLRSFGLASQIPLWDSDAKCSLTRALGESE